jgi:hypothetical protein
LIARTRADQIKSRDIGLGRKNAASPDCIRPPDHRAKRLLARHLHARIVPRKSNAHQTLPAFVYETHRVQDKGCDEVARLYGSHVPAYMLY